MTYLEELREEIRRVHGADATYVESVPVKETLQGGIVWEGVVEVFDLVDHPTAIRAYAWSHDTDNPANPTQLVTVLHLHPIKSAHDAVKAVIIQELRILEPGA
jgi:hypothetical protein